MRRRARASVSSHVALSERGLRAYFMPDDDLDVRLYTYEVALG